MSLRRTWTETGKPVTVAQLRDSCSVADFCSCNYYSNQAFLPLQSLSHDFGMLISVAVPHLTLYHDQIDPLCHFTG